MANARPQAPVDSFLVRRNAGAPLGKVQIWRGPSASRLPSAMCVVFAGWFRSAGRLAR
jgi:hypothetical protein